ncbi:unnamed protein product [Vicia faba]|uniref:PB1-like domain-containing protein n=1 Tax=Vicia faba TaxID=3906 RepID=A0AAV1AAM4_VICFA|nr:unnamed protein product [Vicia faba]
MHKSLNKDERKKKDRNSYTKKESDTRGEVSNWKCDGDRWSYFEILCVDKEMRYPGVLEVWYDFVGKLKSLENDFGAIELLNWSKTNGKVNLYTVHPISQSEVIKVVEPQTAQTEIHTPTTRDPP